MEWTDNVNIETPEQIDVSLEVAGAGSRFVARVYDWVVKLVIAVLIILALWGVVYWLGSQGMSQAVGLLLVAICGALYFCFFMGYEIYFEVHNNGQTPGKKIAGIRVIREGGAPVDFTSSCIRNLLALVDFLPFFYLLGGLLVLLNVKGQRLGDMAAGTIVIRERSLDLLPKPTKEVEQLASENLTFTAEQLAACAPGDRHILRSFFQRFRQLETRPRYQLAQRLAGEFQRKINHETATTVTTGEQAVIFLASLYRDLEKLAQHGA
jgi:uncharacterized RDD family membrane protein YckC